MVKLIIVITMIVIDYKSSYFRVKLKRIKFGL